MIPTYPTIVTRAGKGSPLENSELDANFTNIRAYDLTLANLISGSINPDGTLVAGSVGSNALQAAAVTLAALNPSLLYSIIPVDTDAGTTGNAYVITARGGLNGSNIVPGGATYDANGNYVLTGLTLNYGYYWTKGLQDLTVVVNSANTISASGAFTAIQAAVTLTGTPTDAVTATVTLVAPVSAYRDGQMFFIYTNNASLTGATLNVNNIGAVPILMNGNPIAAGTIGANSVFAVAYKSGAFVLFGSGSSSSSGSSSNISYTLNGTTIFSSGNLPVPGSGASVQVTHGFGVPPSALVVSLVKVAADSGPGTVGQYYPVTDFQIGTAPAFKVSFDNTNVYVTQGAGTPTLGGAAITPANWGLNVNAVKSTGTPGIVFPALTYSFPFPVGCMSYGQTLFAWNYGFYAPNIVFTTAINLANNEILSVLPPTGQTAGSAWAQEQNHAVFTRADGTFHDVFTSLLGVYDLPVIQPVTNIIGVGTQYTSGGTYSIAINPGAALTNPAYTITPGANDISYSLDNVTFINFVIGTQVTIPTSSPATTLYLKGLGSANVTARVMTATATWAPTLIGSFNTTNFAQKPVWITESGGAITNVYVVDSSYSAGVAISAATMYNMASGGTVTLISSSDAVGYLDFTNNAIGNITPFQAWHSSGSGALINFFQYNPFSRRIYIVTNQIGLLHIFQINAGGAWGNDITAFWAASSTARWAGLTYLKSIAISGGGQGVLNPAQENMTIEIDQTTGLEKAITFCKTTDLTSAVPNGSVTRIPWVE